jgi:hypothetical protein
MTQVVLNMSPKARRITHLVNAFMEWEFSLKLTKMNIAKLDANSIGAGISN